MAKRPTTPEPGNALRYARRAAVLKAQGSADALEASAKRLLSDLAARGAAPEKVRAFRAAFAAHTDVTRRSRVVFAMLAALEEAERPAQKG